jgi:glycosyltransferase involved in cell wall biosynthesis
VNGSVPLDELAATEPAIPVAPPYAVVAATLIRRYGVDVAIRALARLDGPWARLRLVVLGDGEERGELEALCERLGVRDRVSFLGHRPWNEAMSVVRGASVGLVPVRADGYGELLLPTKLFEYAGLGVPAVCARLPTLVEHFPPGSVAYFEPEDSGGLAREVERLLADPEAARIQATRLADAARELSWERVKLRYLDAIAGAVDSGDVPAKPETSEPERTVAAG